jgi:hypothetical protein
MRRGGGDSPKSLIVNRLETEQKLQSLSLFAPYLAKESLSSASILALPFTWDRRTLGE